MSGVLGALVNEEHRCTVRIGPVSFPARSNLPLLSFRDKAPGQRECDYSIDGINRCIRDIEQASLAAVSQSLATRDDISVEVRKVV